MSSYGMALAQSEDTIVYGMAFLCVFRVMMCLLMERLLFRVKMPFCMKWLFL